MFVDPSAPRPPSAGFRTTVVLGPVLLLGLFGGAGAQTDPLPSWNDGTTKQSVFTFVQTVTDRASPQFVPPEQRIATFDNDGTLWAEQPIYFQLAFVLDRVKALAPQHPEWKTRQAFKAVLDSDMTAVAASGQKSMIEMLLATHTGMTTEEFTKSVEDWIEWAYDRRSHIGRLDKALDEAKGRGWTVVDMKADWKKIFAFE
jgi:hypothetical protein